MRNRTMRQGLGILTMLLVFVWAASFAAEHPDKSKSGKNTAAKGAAEINWQVLNINNIWTWHRSDGEGNHSPGGEDGVSYPIFTARCVYEDNMVFGGVMYTDAGYTTKAAIQPVRVNGGTYLSNHGMLQGWVTGSGATAEYLSSTADPAARIYRIRRDYKEMSSADLIKDASISNELLTAVSATDAMVSAMKAQYAADWDEWPTQYGAPYIDRNNNGVYDEPPAFQDDGSFTVDSLISGGYDEPGVAGADQGTPADQVLWTVYHGLDRSKTLVFEGSEPIGLEVQKTVWGYKRTDALGNVYFTRYRLINKGGVDVGGGTKGTFYLDSMFLCQWSDIDLGNAGDDLVGSDSALSMGYVYNGGATDLSYQRFNLPPPSSGYDFLGGPLVDQPGDSAIYDFKKVYDKHNLPMSSFAYFSAGSDYSDPDFEDYSSGTGQWWAMLRGYAPIGTINDPPQKYPVPPGSDTLTNFPFSGDPISQTGHVDGLGEDWSFPPGDRRILLNTGPFRMAPNDTQDIYMGFVVGIGGDRLSSVAVMKAYDKACQETFDLVFQVAKSPKNPNVKVTELDGEILLDWSWDAATIKDTEERVVEPGTYEFEGYNIYQFPSVGSDASAAVRVATFDVAANDVKVISDQVFDPIVGQFVLKPVQYGTDIGVNRFVSIAKDYVRDVPKLYNGQEYYFAVTAYSRATVTGYTAALESAPSIMTVRPRAPFGTNLGSKSGDEVTVTRTSGTSDGSVEVTVSDPLLVTGDAYKVGFNADLTWHLVNTTKGDTVLNDQTNQSGDNTYPTTNGLIVKTIGPPLAVNSYSFSPSADRWFTGVNWGGGSFFGGLDLGINFFGSNVLPEQYVTVEVRFLATPTGQNAYRYVRGGTPSYGYQDYIPQYFTVWDVTSVPERQLQAAYATQAGTATEAGPWQTTSSSADRMYLFILNRTYSATADPYYTSRNFNSDAGDFETLYAMWPTNRGGTGGFADIATGQVFKITPNFANTTADGFTFTTAGMQPTSDATLAKASANRVGAFPNPYYTQNGGESDRYGKFITFNNLPRKATVKIFNLAGHLVRTLEKDDASQFLQWNLVNEKNFPVASGIYLCRVDMPDVGVTKIVKLAVIMEQEILDIF